MEFGGFEEKKRLLLSRYSRLKKRDMGIFSLMSSSTGGSSLL
jgi:hypothetical protein